MSTFAGFRTEDRYTVIGQRDCRLLLIAMIGGFGRCVGLDPGFDGGSQPLQHRQAGGLGI